MCVSFMLGGYDVICIRGLAVCMLNEDELMCVRTIVARFESGRRLLNVHSFPLEMICWQVDYGMTASRKK